jgi:D-sedoheptulose 7-phosphate isomerase
VHMPSDPYQSIDPIDTYLRIVQDVLGRVSREGIETMTMRVLQAWEARKQVFLMGNGGSASTASHAANDLSKATIVPGAPRIRAIALTDNVAVMSAWANDAAYEAIFKEQLENLLDAGDTVIGISASGNSPNVLRAMAFARERGAFTIGWTGQHGGRLPSVADLCLHVPSDNVGLIESVHLVVLHVLTIEVARGIANRQRLLAPAAALVRGIPS